LFRSISIEALMLNKVETSSAEEEGQGPFPLGVKCRLPKTWQNTSGNQRADSVVLITSSIFICSI
jgi:hypothetical protein